MTQRQEEILQQSITLFNKKGLNNVKLSDITKSLNISLGNLTYYFKTKKDLITKILEIKNEERTPLSEETNLLLMNDDMNGILSSYLNHLSKYSFFYRDILDIDAITSEAKGYYEDEVQKVLLFIESGISKAVTNSFMIEEPRSGVYRNIGMSTWAILQSWLLRRTLLGLEHTPFKDTVQCIVDLHYPYATEEGILILDKAIANADLIFNPQAMS